MNDRHEAIEKLIKEINKSKAAEYQLEVVKNSVDLMIEKELNKPGFEFERRAALRNSIIHFLIDFHRTYYDHERERIRKLFSAAIEKNKDLVVALVVLLEQIYPTKTPAKDDFMFLEAQWDIEQLNNAFPESEDENKSQK